MVLAVKRHDVFSKTRWKLTAVHKKLILYFIALLLSTAGGKVFAQANFYNVRLYGAKGDGITVDTKSINDAISAAAMAGGGTVYFPAGIYLSFSIRLQHNISLFLDAGCVLLAADSSANGKYDDAEPNPFDAYQDYGHSHWHNSLIWGEGLHDISITGTGIINGKGLRRSASARRPWGNKAIALKNCRNIILEDFTILDGGHFGILATGADNLTIDNLKMDTNRDGMDIDCCSNVRISNCTVNAPWDDAICLKSSFALGYRKATENVTITNCQVSGYDLGTFYNGTYKRNEWKRVPDREGPTGRIKFGTESNGGFKNIAISNCVFDYCRGLALETVDGALLEDISISNITMRDIVNAPLFLRLGARMRDPDSMRMGALRRVSISHVNVYNADSHFASIISGTPGNSVEDISLSNIRIWYRQMDSSFSQIPVTIPENEKQYPEPAKMGIMPAYGFVIRHAKGIRMDHIEVHYLGKEIRPAFYIEDVQNIFMSSIFARPVADVKSFVLKNSLNFSLQQSGAMKSRRISSTEYKRF
jgi:polygalacturonase